jgi:hypothetical protein
MRWWCVRGYAALVRKGTLDREIWIGRVVDMALDYPWLMDIIFGLSATHIAAESSKPSERSAYTSLALEYQSRAIAAARPSLEDVNSTNCHALFAFTVLNIPTSIVLAQLPVGANDLGRSPVESIVISGQWITSLISLMNGAEKWLRGGPFQLAFDKCDDPNMYDESFRPAMQRLLSLLTRSKYAGRGYSKQFDLFSRGVELLESYFCREKSMAIGWPAELGTEFFEQVHAKDSFALLLTMHWGVLLHSLEMWWGSFTGKRLVDQISRDFSECENDQTREAIHWARVQVGLDIKMTWS